MLQIQPTNLEQQPRLGIFWTILPSGSVESHGAVLPQPMTSTAALHILYHESLRNGTPENKQNLS